MPAPVPFPQVTDQKHSHLEDAQGLFTGMFFCTAAMLVLTHLGLLTGQMAGLAVIISYLTGWSFGLIFFVINLPFYWLAWNRMGKIFTLKSLGCVAGLSLMLEFFPPHFQLAHVSPWFGALLFGIMSGSGLLAIFRHGGSLGGLGVVALMVQDQTGFKAGHLQLIFDACLFSVAFFLFPTSVVLYSLLGAFVVNIVISFNHRRDRYIAH
ncbi:MAG: YitT family protein [Rhodobacteraceae bacterium]|nr:YitT family protein [Paracoccaceae bacterium]